MSKSFLIASGRTITQPDNTTRRYSMASANTQTAEASAEIAVRDALTVRNLFVHSVLNTVTANTVVTVRKSLADTSVAVTIPADTAGDFTDLSNNASYAATDELSVVAVAADDPTASSIQLSGFSFELEPSAAGDCVSLLQINGTASLATASGVYFLCPHGTVSTAPTTEAQQKLRLAFDCTVRNLRAYVSSNGRTQPSVVTLRKNGADATSTTTITGSGTGPFEDTTHTDSFVAGDDIDYTVILGTGAGTVTITGIGITLVSTQRWFQVMASATAGTTLNFGATTYVAVGGNLSTNTTEDDFRVRVPFDCTLSMAGVMTFSNTINGASTLTLRKNGVDTALVVTIPAATADFRTNTSDSVFFAAGDEITWKAVGGGSSGSLVMRWISLAGRTAGAAAAPFGTVIG